MKRFALEEGGRGRGERGKGNSKQSVDHLHCKCAVVVHGKALCDQRPWSFQIWLGSVTIPGAKNCISISGLVAEYIVAIDVTRARFPADANILNNGCNDEWLIELLCLLCSHNAMTWHWPLDDMHRSSCKKMRCGVGVVRCPVFGFVQNVLFCVVTQWEMLAFFAQCCCVCLKQVWEGGTDFAMTPSPSLFFLSASPCLKGLGLALGKNKEGEGVMEDEGGGLGGRGTA